MNPSTIRILHVDDNPDVVELSEDVLEREDNRFEVITATGPDDGRAILSEEDIDCIVSDYDMPEQNGIEFLETVREDHSDLPFILYTGKGSEAVASDAISAGVTDYLQKGGGTSQYTVLANRITNAVEQYRSRRQLEASKERLALFFDRSPLGVVEWDENFNVVRLNEAAQEILGYDESTLVGESWERIVPPSDEDEVRDIVAAVLDAEGGYRSVNKNVTASGDLIICEWHNRVITNDDGDVVTVFSQFQDVTEREEKRQHLETVLDNLPGYVYRHHNEEGWPLEFVKGSVESVTGYTPSELEELTLAEEIIHPEDREYVQNETAERLEEQGRYDLTYRILTKNDEVRWIWERGKLVENPVTGDEVLEGFITGITDRIERERELTAAQRRFQAVFNNPISFMALLDVDGTVITINETALEFVDQTVDDVSGKPFWETPWWTHSQELQADLESWVERAASGELVRYESEHFAPSGEQVTVDGVLHPVRDEDGSVVSVLAAARDITDRKDRERVLREMYDIFSDRDRTFEEQIQSLLEVGRETLGTKYGTLSRIDGEDYLFEFVAADDESIAAGDIVPVQATNCEIVANNRETIVIGNIERDAPGETGRDGYTEWGISCYIGAPVHVGDDVYGTFCFYDTEPRSGHFSEWEETLVDLMSNWVSYELERRRTNEQLQEKTERLEQFSSVVSHDLRNPLNVATLRLELAQRDCDSDHLDGVEQAHERMERLIEDLLTMARNGAAVNPEPVDIAAVVADAWQNVETRESSLRSDVDATVLADEGQLKQVFENLFRNAVEHGSENVVVTVGELDDGLYVEDDGPGIPDENQDKVFDAGYSTSQGGTGFGLSIVEEAAEAHDLDVSVTEGTDGGARFEITGFDYPSS